MILHHKPKRITLQRHSPDFRSQQRRQRKFFLRTLPQAGEHFPDFLFTFPCKRLFRHHGNTVTAQQSNPQSVTLAQPFAESPVIDKTRPAGRRSALDNRLPALMPQRRFQRTLRPARKGLRQIRAVISQNAFPRNLAGRARCGQLRQPLGADRHCQAATYQLDNRRARIGTAVITTGNARKAGADDNAGHGILALWGGIGVGMRRGEVFRGGNPFEKGFSPFPPNPPIPFLKLFIRSMGRRERVPVFPRIAVSRRNGRNKAVSVFGRMVFSVPGKL